MSERTFGDRAETSVNGLEVTSGDTPGEDGDVEGKEDEKRNSVSVSTPGSPEVAAMRRDGGDESGDTSSQSHDTADSAPPRREKRKEKGRRGKDHRGRAQGEELQESSLRNSHKIVEDDSDEEVKNSRRKQKRSQAQLRFDSADGSSEKDKEERERERRETRKGRRGADGRRRRKTKGDQDDTAEDSEDKDAKKRGTLRKSKRRADDDSESSSSRYSLPLLLSSPFPISKIIFSTILMCLQFRGQR